MGRMEIVRSSEGERWCEKLKASGVGDVYFTMEYAQTFEFIEGGVAHLFCYEAGEKRFVYPFRLRRLGDVEALAEFGDWCDIASDYGYGGPVISVPREEKGIGVRDFVRDAVEAFDEFCAGENVVSEFCRFHPLMANHAYLEREYEPVFCNQTVWIDLRVPEDEILRQMRENHRRDIRRAEKLGVRVEISEAGEQIDAFYGLYIQTMKDVGASRYFFFPIEFFRQMLARLAGRGALFCASYEGTVVASVLYVWGDRFLHYHFGGLDRAYGGLRGNKLLHFHAIRWGKRQGLERLHLGGGVGGCDTDSLMWFKGGFSSLRAEFYVARRIHNMEMYRRLCKWVDVDPALERYFPAYRAVLES